jgi:uncharacterized protein (TIGR00645 family)
LRRLRNHHPNPTPIELARHADPLEWLSHGNVSALKVKLAKAMIGISAIHLLKAFIAWIDRLMSQSLRPAAVH